MEKFGKIFISNILNTIDHYEDKRMYDYLHLNIFEEGELVTDKFDLNSLKIHINKKINENSTIIQYELASETLVIFHIEKKNLDFISFTSLFSEELNQYVTLITSSPGSIYDMQTDFIEIEIHKLSIQNYIQTWKQNVILINQEAITTDTSYDSIYTEITNRFPNDENLNTIYSTDEIEQLKEELENLKMKVAENEKLSKQQLDEFSTIIDELKNIKPLDTKKQWVSNFMAKTSNFIKKHPTTSSSILFNITNGFSTVHTLPVSYFADKALQLGLPKEDVNKAFKINE